MRGLTTIMAAFALAACSTTAGTEAKTMYSGFDDAAVVHIDPHGNACTQFICTGFGGQWQESKPDIFLLRAAVFNETTAILGVSFNIDGETVELERAGGFTDFERVLDSVEGSEKDFVAPVTLIDRILTADRVWMRVTTSDGNIEDAVVDGDKDSKAYNALKRFSAEIEKVGAAE
ncbi:hypothetical protein [Henriciella sp.]|uniref:hypothetical protein n=1 Tax=Henriciella sp. TaxID=1968823 RepID=UPI0026248F70|nr:hypothetical protein [Henriciella sp.]